MSKYIIIDSREKPKAIGKILDHFDKSGIEYEVSKLLFGDYMDWNRPGIVVDRKQNIAELAKNCTVEHERFRREMEKAQKAGATLVVLVEQNRYKDRDSWVEVNSIEDLLRWSSPHTMVRGEKVYRVLASWTAKYPLRVEFCDKRQTGRRIAEILYSGDPELK
jgi:ERCC4-type nuclease